MYIHAVLMLSDKSAFENYTLVVVSRGELISHLCFIFFFSGPKMSKLRLYTHVRRFAVHRLIFGEGYDGFIK